MQFLDRGIGDNLVELKAIGEVCYDRYLCVFAAIARRVVVGHRTIGGICDHK